MEKDLGVLSEFLAHLSENYLFAGAVSVRARVLKLK